MRERLYIYIMKRILLIGICLLFTGMVYAQKSQLSLDEHNKYVYYEVVDMPGISADSLHKNSAYFVKSMYPNNKSIKISDPGILIKDKFLTYTSFVKHESGEMTYTLNIEFKDSKYRYWLTDFSFTPYERNRYGVFVPSSPKNIPLETAASKVDKKEIAAYIEQTGAFCKQLGEKLKEYMAENHAAAKKPDQQPAKIVTDKW